jgi:uncharacterized protein YndB with AHSA1/START domain
LSAANDATGQVHQELVISRIINAPRKLVFRAWTDPEHFMRWWGPKGYTVPFCKIDPRPGGRIRFCMRSPEGHDIWNGGVFQEVVAPERLVSTDYFTDEQGNPVPPTRYGMGADFPAEAVITVTFEEHETGQTKLTLRQTLPASVAQQSAAQQGWSESFDRLAEYLATA